MKLCPVCKAAIIPNSWCYCFACEHRIDPAHSAWDGGFPCGGVAYAVAYNIVTLIVKNEIVCCEDEEGFAIYDVDDCKVGVLYRKADDGCYLQWKGINYMDCKLHDSNGKSNGKIVHLGRGSYDVEAVFFKEYREIFGDNRKIIVSGRYRDVANFDEVTKDIIKHGSTEFLFYGLQAGEMKQRICDARRNYKRVLLGAFLFNEHGEIEVVDNKNDLEDRPSIVDLFFDKSTEYYKNDIIRSSAICHDRNSLYEMYSGEICYDLNERRHIVYFDRKLLPVIDKLKQDLLEKVELIRPVFLMDN